MRRLPGILLLTGATLIVIVALLVSGLRLVLPHLNAWRPVILDKIEAMTGTPVDASQIRASWENFGPTLDVRDVKAGLKDGGEMSIKRVTLALDIWQSLIHARWQFRDLTFYQLHLRTNTPLSQNKGDKKMAPGKISDLFLRQFDHFDLRDSSLSFLTLSGQRAELTIPQLNWLNTKNRHRAEGQVSLSSFNGQHGLANVRMDLRDDNGILNIGKVWLQADRVDVKPWLGRWMQDNIDLQNAEFSLEAWVDIKKGDVAGGNIWLKQGGSSWKGEKRNHTLSVDNLMARVNRDQTGWNLAIPSTNITLDGKTWPKGSLSMAWIGPQDVGGKEGKRSEELHVRATNMELESFNGLLPIAAKVSPDLGEIWQIMQPRGHIDVLAADIPLQETEKTRLQGRWKNVSWNQWKLLPGMENFSGSVTGSVEHGQLKALVSKAKMPYETVFRAPLEVEKGAATLEWQKNASGFQLDGKQIDVKARSLWARGDFRYYQPAGGDPWLSILAGISTSNGADAWRYFPENLMGKDLVDYLSGAIQGGQADSATLVYGGNPHLFPYKHNEGQFEVLVPLRNAKFAFQPDWPALENLNIELDFLNDGLWMKTPGVKLGGVTASNLTAIIPDYSKEKLLIDSDISGPGSAVGPYFKETPLEDSLAAALDELQIGGDVNARLHLDIPLDGKMTTAKGDVVLKDNTLLIKPLSSTLKNLSGKFSFVNGDLQSEPLRATWFNQPVEINFDTKTGAKAYQIGVNLNGNWQLNKTGVLPEQINKALSGSAAWKSNVGIVLPYEGKPTYSVDLDADLKSVSSHLPAPVNKSAGQPLPLKIAVKGDLNSFNLTGSAAGNHRFSSRWLLNKKLTLDRAIWATNSHTVPPLPDHKGLELDLPAMDGAQWLALFSQGATEQVSHSAEFPSDITLRTPALTLGGQVWNNLSLVSKQVPGGTQINAQGREVNGTLNIRDGAPWQATIKYLYFNPDWSIAKSSTPPSGTAAPENDKISFRDWPDMQLRCAECWLWGQKYGRIDGDVAITGDTLKLTNGLVDNGFARLTGNGEWVNTPGETRTSLKGKLKGKKLDAATNFFGAKTPIQDSSFDLDYDLHWRNAPWKPETSSLNGILHTRLGKGQISDLGTGHAGQLLRLVSFDALLRKMRFDFSDTFGDGFYFDSIRSTAWIKDGVLHTDDTLVDGLEADIAMKGSVDLVRRQLNMEAVVAPEISATVGVATAFVINPIVGAAVFAASKVLGPLWSKISVLRYHISGPIDDPKINEVLRQPRVNAVK
ncbi:AsmA2 domain-containing protein YhdP [Enterobacteriaceae bacterium H11S18]|uniref:AsmA2 domain-containing protein YhdP n=1 Tax=Dryocola clanedunensis TaxID=2925396 RepID=UPI0022EFD9FD|nr:AsmA2 domain-containing protein YhdP [Dryocola clanedunensis]MCT4710056.1 AsmA2 domain-containing protein YhdP [Dryocola clanedunensis]